MSLDLGHLSSQSFTTFTLGFPASGLRGSWELVKIAQLDG